MEDVDRMRKILAEDPNIKYGFVVFRCVYGNDKAWAKFMWHLNERVRRALKEEGAEELFERIDWCVQEHPRLCFADEGNVRRYATSVRRTRNLRLIPNRLFQR